MVTSMHVISRDARQGIAEVVFFRIVAQKKVGVYCHPRAFIYQKKFSKKLH